MTHEGCLGRQAKVRQHLNARELDALVVTDSRDVYHLTGTLLPQNPLDGPPTGEKLETPILPPPAEESTEGPGGTPDGGSE